MEVGIQIMELWTAVWMHLTTVVSDVSVRLSVNVILLFLFSTSYFVFCFNALLCLADIQLGSYVYLWGGLQGNCKELKATFSPK